MAYIERNVLTNFPYHGVFFKKEIDELADIVNNIQVDAEGAILGSFIDKQEKDNILQNLSILEREKLDIDNRFKEWYNSSFLYGNLKQTYKQVYDEYVNKYNILYNLCNTSDLSN